MPKIRERDQTDQIKSTKKPRKAPNPQTRRIMTAKLKKELVQRKRADLDHGQTARDANASNEAVGQTEQAAGIAIQEIGSQLGPGLSGVVTKVKKNTRHPKQQQELPEKRTGTMKEVPEPSKPKTNPKAHPAEITERPQGTTNWSGRHSSTQQQRVRQFSDAQRKPLQQFRQKHKGELTGEQFSFHEWTSTPDTPPASSENPSSKSPSVYPSIKERPRRSFSLKEKPSAGAITLKTRQRIERNSQGYSLPTKPPDTASKQSVWTPARHKARREAQKSMAKRVNQTAKTTGATAKKAAGAAARAVKYMISTLSALAGGGVLVCVLCVVFLVAAIIASPFGILFSNEPSPGAVPLSTAISQVNQDFADKLAQLQAGDYDDIIIQGEPPDWREAAAVFACRTAGTDGVDVAALTPDRVARLEAVFWDMCGISSETKTVDHPADGDGDGRRETILHITITPKTADEMRRVYTFDGDQNSALTQLLQPGMLDGLRFRRGCRRGAAPAPAA